MKIYSIFDVQDFHVVICRFFYSDTKNNEKNSKEILDTLRDVLDGVFIQIVNESVVFNIRYIKEVLKISIESYKRQILATKKLETDILMRLTHCDQIFEAIKIGGIEKNSINYIIIFSKDISRVQEAIKKIKKMIKKYEIKSIDNKLMPQVKTAINRKTKRDIQYQVEKASLITGK